jgi:hypothetical protein
MVPEPRRPLESHIRPSARDSMNGRCNEWPLSTCDIRRCYILNWACAFGVDLLVTPIDTFDAAGKVKINSWIERWVTILLSVLKTLRKNCLDLRRPINNYAIKNSMRCD